MSNKIILVLFVLLVSVGTVQAEPECPVSFEKYDFYLFQDDVKMKYYINVAFITHEPEKEYIVEIYSDDQKRTSDGQMLDGGIWSPKNLDIELAQFPFDIEVTCEITDFYNEVTFATLMSSGNVWLKAYPFKFQEGEVLEKESEPILIGNVFTEADKFTVWDYFPLAKLIARLKEVGITSPPTYDDGYEEGFDDGKNSVDVEAIKTEYFNKGKNSVDVEAIKTSAEKKGVNDFFDRVISVDVSGIILNLKFQVNPDNSLTVTEILE